MTGQKFVMVMMALFVGFAIGYVIFNGSAAPSAAPAPAPNQNAPAATQNPGFTNVLPPMTLGGVNLSRGQTPVGQGMASTPAPSAFARPAAPFVGNTTPQAPTAPAAADYKDGLAAVHRGDYATALKLLTPLAQKGHAWAQYNLGVMYDQGEGVALDDKEAVKWYQAAAEQGNSTAQFNLGVMYNDGRGVAQDYKEAVKWYRLAADQGFPQAQGNLGRMYGLGRGVAQDYVYAHIWLNLAAASLRGDEFF
jgi:TPR repeat protein